jgi:exopolyphosphatase / guanosine-5'-triphosphate,3'-diphosphate pyrophosphatase
LTRVAVVDIGTNSTRLLVADVDVDAGTLSEVDRRSIVTRLGEGVDATGALGEAPRERVFAALEEYAAAIAEHGATAATAVMTSAVRDAANGREFATAVRERHGLEGRTLSGDEEARLTFLGATAARANEPGERLLVIDIGGGSTELVIGERGEVAFHVSTQVGVVRHSERHLHTDPPTPAELDALAADAGPALAAAVPASERERVTAAVAVAGTATQAAGVDLGRRPADVEGHRLSLPTLHAMLERLAGLPLAERREVPGLDPARAPTIVAGVVVLTQALAAFGLDEVEASDRDILWGAALELASADTAT